MVSIEIKNLVDYMDDGVHQERDLDSIEGFMIHRCGVDLIQDISIGTTAMEVGDAFLGRIQKWKEVAEATNYQNPYTIIIDSTGEISQLLPLDEIGHHARRFSSRYVGIGCIGDFRVGAMVGAQYASLCDSLAILCSAWTFDPYKRIVGHGEIQGGVKAPGAPHACPGDRLDLNALRFDVAEIMKDDARARLDFTGFSW